MKSTNIESSVLKKIAPSKIQVKEINIVASDFIKTLNKNLTGAEAILGGSVAKNTFFKDKTDIDIFVRFNFETFVSQSAKLSDLLQLSLKKAFPKPKLHRVHGSRDYFQLQFQGFLFEVVPILLINQSLAAVNITDISPLHTVWVNKQASSIKNQIRLTKQFAKARGAYGAESYIGGFSGYVLEILTIHYGSFQNLLEASLKWKGKQVVDVENQLKGKDVFMEIDIAKLNSPLIVVDPVDKYRNAAAALSEEKWKRFKDAAKYYLKSPNTSFFENQEISKSLVQTIAKNKKRNLIYFEVAALPGKKDVVGCQLLKVFDYLKLKLQEFGIREADWVWESSKSARFYICTSKKMLPKEQIKKGPPIGLENAAKNFRKVNSKYSIYEEGGSLFAKVPIKTRDLEAVTKKLLASKYIAEKIKKVNILEF